MNLVHDKLNVGGILVTNVSGETTELPTTDDPRSCLSGLRYDASIKLTYFIDVGPAHSELS